MSQPMSGTMGKRGLERDKPDRIFVEPPYEPRKRVKRYGKSKSATGYDTVEEETSPARDIVSVILVLVGVISLVTAMGVLFGPMWALACFGALSLILGVVIGVL